MGFMEGEVTKGFIFLRVPKLFPVNIHSTNAANLFIHRYPGMQIGPDKRPKVSFNTRINQNVTNTFFPGKSEVQCNI